MTTEPNVARPQLHGSPAPQPVGIPLTAFLQSTAPGSPQAVVAQVYRQDGSRSAGIMLPPIRVHCSDEDCDGLTYFNSQSSRSNYELPQQGGAVVRDVWHYTCRNCQRTHKMFAVWVSIPEKPPTKVTGTFEESLQILKIGEHPAFGIQASDELSRFLVDDADLFAKGLRAENQGLGIGAYAYYRRVADNQKNHLLDQIEKVIEQQGGSPEISEAIARARRTDRFTRALEEIKGMLPGSLRIDGHNPLQLLYDQLSTGVHEQSDEECLVRAAVIREALSGIAARIAALLKEDQSLRRAISTLTNFENQRRSAAAVGETRSE